MPVYTNRTDRLFNSVDRFFLLHFQGYFVCVCNGNIYLYLFFIEMFSLFYKKSVS